MFIITKYDILQNATVITSSDDFITKWDRYYKMRRLLQIATVQSKIKTTVLQLTEQFKGVGKVILMLKT